MLVNVCPDDIFLTAEHFVTRLGVVMQHYELECHAEKKLFPIFKVKVTVRAHGIIISLFLGCIMNF